MLAATTGEGLTLSPSETERLVFAVRDEAGKTRRLPVLLGLSGSDTGALLDTLERTASWPIDGYLISCPYYSRPSQRGLELHFRALADRASHPVALYNIPYRTGVNLGNEAMLRLASHRNIAGLKDCCADRSQSLELLRRRPQDFAVLTGEDAQYQEALSDGADGGILASAHVETAIFAEIWRLHAAGERDAALTHWRSVADLTKLLFSEPSPAPIKHWLWRTGLIDSRGGAAADDGGERGACGADRCGDRAASATVIARGVARRSTSQARTCALPSAIPSMVLRPASARPGSGTQ